VSGQGQRATRVATTILITGSSSRLPDFGIARKVPADKTGASGVVFSRFSRVLRL
jgi:hypothetical protein